MACLQRKYHDEFLTAQHEPLTPCIMYPTPCSWDWINPSNPSATCIQVIDVAWLTLNGCAAVLLVILDLLLLPAWLGHSTPAVLPPQAKSKGTAAAPNGSPHPKAHLTVRERLASFGWSNTSLAVLALWFAANVMTLAVPLAYNDTYNPYWYEGLLWAGMSQ